MERCWWSWWWWRSSPCVRAARSAAARCSRWPPCRGAADRALRSSPVEQVLRSSGGRRSRPRGGGHRPRRQLVRTTRRCSRPSAGSAPRSSQGKKSPSTTSCTMRGELAKLTRLVDQIERERREHVGELTSAAARGRPPDPGARRDHPVAARGAVEHDGARPVGRAHGRRRPAARRLRRRRQLPRATSRSRGSGGIPDYTFLLPQGLALHMDVKFPLNNYLRFLDADLRRRARAAPQGVPQGRARSGCKEVTSRGYVDPAGEHRRLRAAVHPQRAGLRLHPGAGPHASSTTPSATRSCSARRSRCSRCWR